MGSLGIMNSLKPRTYQKQLFEYAIKENSIIYLPTGSGKTFIAILVINHLSKDVHIPLNQGGKRSIFIVKTLDLAEQQAQVIKQMTGLKTSIFTGKQNTDSWSEEKWRSEINSTNVIVGTCQLILNIICRNFLTIKNINFIIFDECHNARKNDCMVQLMNLIKDIPKHQQPLLMGLTGLLLGGQVKSETVIQDLKKLENTFLSTIRTVNTIDDYVNVLLYSTNPDENYIIFRELKDDSCLANALKIAKNLEMTIFDWKIDKNLSDDITRSIGGFMRQFIDMGFYGGSIAISSLTKEFSNKRGLTGLQTERLIYSVCLTGFETIKHLLELEMANYTEIEKILKFSSPKVQKLFIFLEQYNEKYGLKDMKAIIFVQECRTAKGLYRIIKNYTEGNPILPILPDFVIGTNRKTSEAVDVSKLTKCNSEIIENFKTNKTNLIVASKVLEEGMDLQMCNLVIAYDYPQTFTSYIQSKGRARMKNSKYIIMTPESKLSELNIKIEDYKKIDEHLKEFLIGSTVDNYITESDITIDCDGDDDDDEIEPFISPAGAVLQSLSAIQFVNGYCQSLTGDMYSVPNIIWKPKYSNEQYVVSIQLPPQTNISTVIVGDPMNNIKTAKRSAAFKTCMLLYRMGELDDHFKPCSTNYLNSIKHIYFNHWLQFTDKIDFESDIKEYRLHKNIFPEQFFSCYPKSNEICYLYIITVSPAVIEHNRHQNSSIVQSLVAQNSNYGILLTKKLPTFALINLFPSFGEVSVQIEENPILMKFEKESEIHLLRRFHFFLFKDILKLWKEEYIPENNSFIIVPVKGNEINWSLVETFDILPACRKKTAGETTNMEPNDYLHKVVTPWYRSEHFCIVTKICDDLSPMSKFPNREYSNYYDYYRAVHGVTIRNKSQFLIEVKILKSNLNFLNMESGGNKNFNVQSILLVPELCHNYVFPAEMWIKATLLPSTLHRLNHLLLADNLKSMLAKYVEISETKSLLPIEVDEFCKTQTYNTDFSYLNDSLWLEHMRFNQNTGNDSSSSEDLISDSIKSIKNYDKIRILENNKIKSIEQKDILKALTTAAAGDVFSLEKAEILGDAFLKFSVSLYLFYKYPERHEGFLTASKNLITNNRNLYYCGLKTGVPGLMKVFKFDQTNWLPPLITTSEILNFKPYHYSCPKITERKPKFHSYREQPISDKSIADCIEALLGVCCVSLGINESYKILQLFKILPDDDVLDNIGKYRSSVQQQSTIDNQVEIKKCEQILGYRFQNKDYLLQALTHPSCISSYIGCYQKLEFLGDAVLDHLITAYLYEHCGDFSPGKITDIRSALVNNTALSCLCVKNKLHKFILHESEGLGDSINRFEKYQIKNNHKLTDNVQIQEEYIADYVNIPKALGDVFEAVLGAIFVDSYHNLELVWNILYKLIAEELHEFIENVPINLVRQLHEFPDAQVVFNNAQAMENGVIIQVKFNKNGEEKTAFGIGKNKNDAKKAAAKSALQILRN